MDSLAIDSQLGNGLLFVGDDKGGVTGALFEIRRGGSDEGIAFRRNGRRLDGLLASPRVGLVGYDGTGLGKDEDKGLGFWEE